MERNTLLAENKSVKEDICQLSKWLKMHSTGYSNTDNLHKRVLAKTCCCDAKCLMMHTQPLE